MDVLAVQLTSAVIMLLGVTVHSTIIFLSQKKRNSDNLAYVLFLKVCSFLSICDFLCGSLIIERIGHVDNNFLFIFYGIISHWGPRMCSIMDSLNGFLGDVVYILVPTGMFFRTLIAFDFKLKDRHVIAVMILVVLAQMPIPIIQWSCYTPIDDYLDQMSPLDQAEATNNSGFIQILPSDLAGFYYIQVAPWRIYVYIPITFFLVLLTSWRVSLYRQQMSSRTAKIHRSFIRLLFLEGIGLCVAVFAAYLLRTRDQSMLSRFTRYCTLSSIPIVQGIAMLLLVPYFRAEILYLLGRSNTEERSSASRGWISSNQ